MKVKIHTYSDTVTQFIIHSQLQWIGSLKIVKIASYSKDLISLDEKSYTCWQPVFKIIKGAQIPCLTTM